MSKKSHTPGPVPAGNRSDAGTDFEEPNQDESGKTAAPQSEQGLDNDQKPDGEAASADKRTDNPRPM